jgi:UDP-GlcNAc3NAcA epimerase
LITIVTVVGARPQFIKAAPLSKALKKHTQLREVMVHTGQHYDSNMSETFFNELSIKRPDYNLRVGSGGHGQQAGEIMKKLEPILIENKPRLAIIFGDTNSTLAGAITASKLRIPVAHVEAGLRSFNRKMPEEINRIVADHLASLLFCPTTTSVRNLEKEGIRENVFNIGDIMYDVVLQFSSESEKGSSLLRDLELGKKDYILATIHRAENTDNRKRLFNIFSAFKELSREKVVVIPLHPRTRKMLHEYHIEDLLKGLKVLEPVGFLDMLSLEKNALLIATDSGGVQKEAYFHRVPCVTFRDETEWIETLEAQWNTLVNVDSVDGIIETVHESSGFLGERQDIAEYGDGRTSEKIVHIIRKVCYSGK